MSIEKKSWVGSVVYVRYRDHVLFRDLDANMCQPWGRECVGWLDHEGRDYVRIIWERFVIPDPPKQCKPKATGLVILKRAILEMHKVA